MSIILEVSDVGPSCWLPKQLSTSSETCRLCPLTKAGGFGFDSSDPNGNFWRYDTIWGLHYSKLKRGSLFFQVVQVV
jgi:hypothetical protein